MTSEEKLKLDYEHAGHRLEMVENIGSWIAIATGFGAGYLFGWIAGVAGAFLLFYAITYAYRDPLSKAKDAYLKASKLGQYGHLRETSDE